MKSSRPLSPARTILQTAVLTFVLLAERCWGFEVIQSEQERLLEGDTCRDNTDCRNNGVCQEPTMVTRHRHCHCFDGFSGQRCTQFCPFACQNGGICTKKMVDEIGEIFVEETNELDNTRYEYDPNNYMCKCHGYFVGKLCEIPYVNCGQNRRCFNGGECVYDDDPSSAAPNTVIGCSCPEAFTGDFCQDSVDLTQLNVDYESLLSKEDKISVSLMMFMIALFGVFLLLVRRVSNRGVPRFVSFDATGSSSSSSSSRMSSQLISLTDILGVNSRPPSLEDDDDSSSLGSNSSHDNVLGQGGRGSSWQRR